jgi:alkaline phosphatase
MKADRIFVAFILIGIVSFSSPEKFNAPIKYSVANAHSHNDYAQNKPFTSAYQARFGSMEADIFLSHDSLYVGHEKADIARHRSLQALYLDSVAYYIRQNGGFPYENHEWKLQLLIDVKTSAVSTLNALVKVLESYPDIIQCNSLTIVITGNRPALKKWTLYPAFVKFDGRFKEKYSESVWARIEMVSSDLSEIIKWNGSGVIGTTDSIHLAAAVEQAHARGKKARFWGAPDFPNAWIQLMHANIDWINTDHIQELADFLNKKQD